METVGETTFKFKTSRNHECQMYLVPLNQYHLH